MENVQNILTVPSIFCAREVIIIKKILTLFWPRRGYIFWGNYFSKTLKFPGRLFFLTISLYAHDARCPWHTWCDAHDANDVMTHNVMPMTWWHTQCDASDLTTHNVMPATWRCKWCDANNMMLAMQASQHTMWCIWCNIMWHQRHTQWCDVTPATHAVMWCDTRDAGITSIASHCACHIVCISPAGETVRKNKRPGNFSAPEKYTPENVTYSGPEKW